MEYFVFQDDELWSSPDEKLIKLAHQEIARLGPVRPEEIENGTVVRMPRAYPIYQDGFSEQVGLIRSYIEQNLVNLQLVGCVHCVCVAHGMSGEGFAQGIRQRQRDPQAFSTVATGNPTSGEK